MEAQVMSDGYAPGTKCFWVIASYAPFSERGKQVLALAETGTGYILQNKDRAKGDNIIVAFMWPAHKTLNDGLVKATPEQVYRLEQRYGKG